jgi:multiple sugar transport system permease protein
MSAIWADESMARVQGREGFFTSLWRGRTKYLLGAVMIVLALVMLLPIYATVTASVKLPSEAAAIPPTYVPQSLSFESYEKLWAYQHGLPRYLFNSFATALLAIVFTIALTVPAGFALARFPIRGKELLFVFLLTALIIPYQALLTPIFLMFSYLKLTNSVVGLAIIHTAIQLPFSLYIMRNSFEAIPKELEEAAVIDGCNVFQVLLRICIPSVVPSIVTTALFAFITSWNEFLAALVMLNRGEMFTLPLVLAASRTVNMLGGTDWGMLQAGVTVSIIPCIVVYLLLQKYYVAGLLSGAVK